MERFAAGSLVRLAQQPPFLKTADPMPMLRSASCVQLNEVGRVMSIRPAGYYGVRFVNGEFLVDHKYLVLASEHETRANTQT